VSVLDKSVQIIDVLGHAPGPVRLGAVAEAVSLPKSSTHRLLGEMARLGLVRHRGDGDYTLGYRLVQWGQLADERLELRTIAEPVMRRLSTDVTESVHLHVPEGAHRVCVAGVDGPHMLRPVITLGAPNRLGVGAAGKLLMAYADPRVRDRALELTPEDARRWLPSSSDLALIRSRGWSTSVGELEPGLTAFAAAVLAPDGAALAALTVAGATPRLPEGRTDEIVRRLLDGAAEIGELVARGE
jgi:DNA-binding IclR family transcriptional regulator